MNNKIKWLEMSFSYMEKTKKYAKANVISAFAYYFFAFAECYFPIRILS